MNDLSPAAAIARLPSAEATVVLDWMSALFAGPPTAEAVAAHRRGRAAALLAALADDAELAPAIALMRADLDRPDGDAEAAARLGRAYVFAFDGVGGPRAVPPYESVHRPGAPRRLFQAPTAEMEALLAEHDLSVAAVGRPADHLAVELALAARLAADGDPEAAAMIARLSAWVPAFAAECAGADREGFWAGAAGALAVIVAREARPTPTNEERRA